MSFFSKILDKLGIGSGGGAAAPRAAATPAPAAGPAHPQAGAPASSAAPPTPHPPSAPSPAAQQAAPAVDVEAKMEQRAASNPQPLNWRTSIVDLLKLLDIDSSLGARKELAKELGCPPELMEDSARMNVWLHKTVLERIAANGGRVPKELLD